MTPTRRAILGGGAISAAALAASTGLAGKSRNDADNPSLAVFDSRMPESVAFVAGLDNAIIRIDLALEDARSWATIRAAALRPGAVVGLTGWSDWVTLKGVFQDAGKRVRQEVRATPHRVARRPVTPFVWRMA